MEIKHLVFFSSLLFALFISCADLTYEEYLEIDAVSSASGDIRVDEGKAYARYAVLQTYHKDSYPHHFIAYGLDTLYRDTLNVADTPRVHICTLVNLQPDSKYYFKFVGDWPTNPIVENHTAYGEFSTALSPLYNHYIVDSDN